MLSCTFIHCLCGTCVDILLLDILQTKKFIFFAELEEEIVDLSSKHKFRKKEVSFWKKKNLRTENLRPQVPRFFLNRYKSNFT